MPSRRGKGCGVTIEFYKMIDKADTRLSGKDCDRKQQNGEDKEGEGERNAA